MGAGQSNASQTSTSRALHVLRVTPSSPASQTSIEPFFDFIIGFDGDSLTSQNDIDASELERIVESHENRTLNLVVWNSKTRSSRVVSIVPSRSWSSRHDEADAGSDDQPSLLGLSMRMCEYESAMDSVWHVLEVIEGSPAESAGLVPYGDWIVGWSGGVLSAENDFYDLVEAHADKPLRVFVYSYDFDNLREVVLIPNRHWGGDGLLGCVFGFGLLHRIPSQSPDHQSGLIGPPLHEPSDDVDEQTLFVPADIPHDHEAVDHEHFASHFPVNPAYSHDPYHRSSQNKTPNLPSVETASSDYTPTRARQYGPSMNGAGMAGQSSLASPRPIPSAHREQGRSVFENIAEDEDEDEDSGDDDEEESVCGTETTDLGSLTSVE